ncbi:hypothetical protein SAMN06295967_11264 [Belliella buryatensis]|uniref:IPT/TIG domain-containing protein n=1 Tax=Belliella buryatensis TaxID=1500549 RepID=A0A239FFR2_9BACT|nr:hypothetical protein [Belliella buryatensis]SNS55002.1 hypothetical protein SAMN06295967_11264 [Belliella buryatensis]
MKNYLFIFIIIHLLGIFSCQEAVEIEIPNPQFSISYIQDIDENGVEFAADVYILGSLPVLEHGFLYAGSNTIPRIGNGEVVKIEGEPGKTFSAKATHSMERGLFYNVAAYMRTADGYVYSEPVRFQSEGSSGFVFENIEIPSPIYFGDTITVFASNLSKLIQSYEVTVSDKKAKIVEINSNSFKFILPGPFDSDKTSYNFIIKVANKTLNAFFPLDIIKPILSEDLKSYNYSDTVLIKGKYLLSEKISIQSPERSPRDFESLISNNDSLITFKLDGLFTSLEPTIDLIIRGIKFDNQKIIKINPTEINPGQKLAVSNEINEIYEIFGKNFNNTLTNNFNEIIQINGENSNIFTYAKQPEINKIFLKQNTPLFGRFNELTISSLSHKFKNSVLIEQTLPDIQIQQPEAAFNNTYNLLNIAKSFQGLKSRNIFTLYGSILEFDTKSSQMIERISSDLFDTNNEYLQYGTENIFNLQHSENIVFVSFYSYNESNPYFLKIDLGSRTTTILPRLPINLYQPRRVFSTDQYLYLEGGQLWEEMGILGEVTNDRWRFNFSNETWEKLSDVNFDTSSPVFEIVNKKDNKNSVLEQDISGMKVLRFNENLEQWVQESIFPIQNTQCYAFIETDSEIVYMANSGVNTLDKISKQVKFYESQSTQFQSQINKKMIFNNDQKFIYFHNDKYFTEFDYFYIDLP